MDNPTLLTILSTAFILLGAYNLFSAARRAREMKLAGQQFKWMKQINALVGIEYLLLAWVFLLTNLDRNSSIPSSVKTIILPLYLICLLAAAIFAGLVIYRGIFNARTIRAQAARSAANRLTSDTTSRALKSTSLQNEVTGTLADSNDRRRERRKNAAAARRRRAGKA
ncbi:MAG TPA: hypothetical protein VGT44_02805 [Ktedonobacteraceae bacterium]|nr:hypothetical protein [Ktedonobacteraceae bacterium]